MSKPYVKPACKARFCVTGWGVDLPCERPPGHKGSHRATLINETPDGYGRPTKAIVRWRYVDGT